MKYRFYIDIPPGVRPAGYGLSAMTIPGAKVDSFRRIAFDVVIPDALMFDVDAHAAEVSRPEVVAEREPQA